MGYARASGHHQPEYLINDRGRVVARVPCARFDWKHAKWVPLRLDINPVGAEPKWCPNCMSTTGCTVTYSIELDDELHSLLELTRCETCDWTG